MMSEKAPAAILQTKPHFEILDGMRGIAAVSVVIFHFMEVAYTDYSKNFIGHGFLAVDFFFCLSGFVIAYAYDSRIARMGTWEFFKSRIIRLHPLVILGSVLGLMALLFYHFGGHPEVYKAGRLVLIFICSAFLVPFPVMEDRAFNLFGLNAPAWSLFWEYVANVVYALILWRLSRRWLVPLVIIAALALCMVGYRAGNLMGGWAGANFWDGGARISYSFLAGMLVYRFNWIIKSRLGFLGLAVLLFAVFVMPFSSWNWLTEPLVVLVYFPLLIALGAGAALSPALHSVCHFSGKISYPLYMTHYAVLWMFGNYYNHYKPGVSQLAVIISTSVIVLVVFAYLVLVVYDGPVRRYLTYKRRAN
jgi:peptidoglycan/LPS O-acetylase OafA/YrhL